MTILVAGATGSIGLHVMNIAIEMGHQPVALVRNKRKVKWLACGIDVFKAWIVFSVNRALRLCCQPNHFLIPF